MSCNKKWLVQGLETSCSWKKACVQFATIAEFSLQKNWKSNFHQTEAKNISLWFYYYIVITYGVESSSFFLLFFIADHITGSIDVVFKHEPTFVGVGKLQDCTALPNTSLTFSPVQAQTETVMAFERHTGGDQCAASVQKQRWGACPDKRGKIPVGDLTLQRCSWCLRWMLCLPGYLPPSHVPFQDGLEGKGHISLMAKSHLTYISWPSHSKQACPWNGRRRTELFTSRLCTIQHWVGVRAVETICASGGNVNPAHFICAATTRTLLNGIMF